MKPYTGQSASRAVARPANPGSVRRMAACLLGLVALVAGCGDRALQPLPTHEVKGRVVLRNGKPLSAGRVVFVPVEGLTPPASGALGPDGSFTLTTREAGDGAAAGG